jgi:hypothetical protein
MDADNVHHDELHAIGVHPDVIGRRLLAAMRAGEFFVFTHDETRAWLDERHERIRAAYDDLERYNAVGRE